LFKPGAEIAALVLGNPGGHRRHFIHRPPRPPQTSALGHLSRHCRSPLRKKMDLRTAPGMASKSHARAGVSNFSAASLVLRHPRVQFNSDIA
jgi:hypothetical protein